MRLEKITESGKLCICRCTRKTSQAVVDERTEKLNNLIKDYDLESWTWGVEIPDLKLIKAIIEKPATTEKEQDRIVRYTEAVLCMRDLLDHTITFRNSSGKLFYVSMPYQNEEAVKFIFKKAQDGFYGLSDYEMKILPSESYKYIDNGSVMLMFMKKESEV